MTTRFVRRFSAVLCAAAGIVLVTTADLYAHDEGVITLSAKQAAAGSSIDIAGAKLGKSASLRLTLRNAFKTIALGQVRTDDSGRFTMKAAIPADATPGQYLVSAIATDGDIAARANLMVMPPGTSTMAGPANMGMSGMSGMTTMPGMHATADPMPLDTTTTPFEKAVMGLFIVLSLAGGIMLLSRSRGIAKVPANIRLRDETHA